MSDVAASSTPSTTADAATAPPVLPETSPRSLPFRPIIAPLLAHRGSAAAIGLASAAQVIVTILHLPGMQCPFIRLTGVPCPGCGLSRACAAMVTGDPAHSLRMHAFALPVLAGVTILLIAAMLPTPLRLKFSNAFARLERTTGITFLLLMGLLVYWLGRLLYAPHAFMSLVAQH
jgi:hypothetical protein